VSSELTSNPITQAVEALEAIRRATAGKCESDALAVIEAMVGHADAALAALRRFEVVEGFTSGEEAKHWDRMVLAIAPDQSDARDRPALLLVRRDTQHAPEESKI
jgi:hypothetical protein